MGLNHILNITAAQARLKELHIASGIARKHARRAQVVTSQYFPARDAFVNAYGIAIAAREERTYVFGESISWQQVRSLADEASALCAFIADTRGRKHFTPDVSRRVLIRVLRCAITKFNLDFDTAVRIQVGDVSNDELVAMIINTTAERYTKFVAAA